MKIIRSMAAAELREPQLASTKKFLELHPEVADCAEIRDYDGRLFQVCYEIANYKYRFVMELCRENDLSTIQVTNAYFAPGIRIYLAILSQNISAEEITRRLALSPTSTEEKGQPFARLSKVDSQHHAWLFELDVKQAF